MSNSNKPTKSTYLIVLHRANCQHNLGGACNCDFELDIRTGIDFPEHMQKRKARNFNLRKIDTKQE